MADKEDNPLNTKSLLQAIIDKLASILSTLQNIESKNTTVNVNVEPNITVMPSEVTVNPNITLSPEINFENKGEMFKRGNIVLKENSPAGVTGSTNYIALPNGNCNLTIGTDWSSYKVRTAKSANVIGGGFDCVKDCSGEVTINDEFYMIRIKIDPSAGGPTYTYMNLAYNCI